MTVLLDTHTFLWFVAGDPKLSADARRLIEDTANRVLLSTASLWEIVVKASIGKLPLSRRFPELIEHDVQGNDIQVLHITIGHLAALSTLPVHHRDPFDRLIIAQAVAESLPVISADKTFDRYPVGRLW